MGKKSLPWENFSKSNISPGCICTRTGSVCSAGRTGGHEAVLCSQGTRTMLPQGVKSPLSPRCGFVCESHKNPHLPKSLFSIWGGQCGGKNAAFVQPDPNCHLCLGAQYLNAGGGTRLTCARGTREHWHPKCARLWAQGSGGALLSREILVIEIKPRLGLI